MTLPRSEDVVTLLHNPRCSTSRKVLELLTGRGIDFTQRRYLDEPLTRAELSELARRLRRAPVEWVRKKEPAYEQAGLGPDSSDAEILDAMASHPILIERPIVVRGGRAALGRPPEAVLELFD